jgi:sulfur carrier protein
MQVFVNGAPREVAEGLTVSRLLEDLKIEPKHVAVEVNLELVPRGQHAQRGLSPGDQLEVVTLVGGG